MQSSGEKSRPEQRRQPEDSWGVGRGCHSLATCLHNRIASEMQTAPNQPSCRSGRAAMLTGAARNTLHLASSLPFGTASENWDRTELPSAQALGEQRGQTTFRCRREEVVHQQLYPLPHSWRHSGCPGWLPPAWLLLWEATLHAQTCRDGLLPAPLILTALPSSHSWYLIRLYACDLQHSAHKPLGTLSGPSSQLA